MVITTDTPPVAPIPMLDTSFLPHFAAGFIVCHALVRVFTRSAERGRTDYVYGLGYSNLAGYSHSVVGATAVVAVAWEALQYLGSVYYPFVLSDSAYGLRDGARDVVYTVFGAAVRHCWRPPAQL